MRIVLKVGTSSLTNIQSKSGVNLKLVAEIVDLVARLTDRGHQVAIISSGAIGLGCHKLDWKERPTKISEKQAVASIGQILLAQVYQDFFDKYRLTIGQVLLTRQCIQDRETYLNASSTLKELLKLGIIPIINENDVVAVDEIKFSDNDYLAALVSKLISADELFFLTDTEGLYSKDPRLDANAVLINKVEKITPEIEKLAGGSGGKWGSGGMSSKINAAKNATAFGTVTHIISHKKIDKILDILDRKAEAGTTFFARQTPVEARKAWIVYALESSGKLYIDTGALEAINNGKSLLSVGLKSVKNNFSRGQAVEIYYEDEFVAKGITKYSSEDLRQIKGHSSEEAERILGYTYGNSVIHCDDLIVLSEKQAKTKN